MFVCDSKMLNGVIEKAKIQKSCKEKRSANITYKLRLCYMFAGFPHKLSIKYKLPSSNSTKLKYFCLKSYTFIQRELQYVLCLWMSIILNNENCLYIVTKMKNIWTTTDSLFINTLKCDFRNFFKCECSSQQGIRMNAS